jgi:hypothetical protein
MLIEERPIGSIKPYENNPRVNDAGVDAVAASLREFGWRQPIVVDENDVIIVGHTLYKAAMKLGMETVPVHVARGLSPEQARAYRIADNQTATLSQWDDDKLPLELIALQQADFDLSLTGFPEDEILRLLTACPARGSATPTKCPNRRSSRSPRRATNGYSAITGFSAATPPRQPTSTGCSRTAWSTCYSPIRRTTSVTRA